MGKRVLFYVLLFLTVCAGCTDDVPGISECGEGCEILEKLVDVTVRIVQWPFTCEYVLRTDLETIIYSADDSIKTLLPCQYLPTEFMVDDTLVVISGFKTNCCFGDEGDMPGCKFEITSIKTAPIQFPTEAPVLCNQGCEIMEELVQVRAKVFQWPSCRWVFETDSALIASGQYLDYNYSSRDILVPCNDFPSEFKSDQLIVSISGLKYNCCTELVHPLVKPGYGCRFEITSIEILSN
jgi:hypothetical protein